MEVGILQKLFLSFLAFVHFFYEILIKVIVWGATDENVDDLVDKITKSSKINE